MSHPQLQQISTSFQAPQPVIQLSGDKPKFEIDVLQRMIDEAKVNHKDVYVIAISGVYRSGKTFLLNLLYTYLEYYRKVV